jgi:hypothetical protein
MHANGEVQLPDISCEKEDRGRSEETGGRRRKEKMRNKGWTGRQNVLNKYEPY